jgi:hypothetical protein
MFGNDNLFSTMLLTYIVIEMPRRHHSYKETLRTINVLRYRRERAKILVQRT